MKRKWMAGILAVILGMVWVGSMGGAKRTEQTGSVPVTGITRGIVCKSLALAMVDQSVCQQADVQILQLSDRTDWYAPYYAYLHQQGIVTTQMMAPSRMVMEMPITTGELKELLSRMQLTELAERYLQADAAEWVDKGLFWTLYEKILCVTDVMDEVSELAIQVYGTAANLTDAVAWQCYTSEGIMGFSGLALDYYIDSWIRVLQRGHEIITILGTCEPVQIEEPAPILADASGIPMIRVLLNNSDYTSCAHGYVELTCGQSWLLQSGEVFEEIPAGEVVRLEAGDARFAFGTVTAHAVQEEIAVPSIQRALGVPSYGGKLEITEDAGGLRIVNELPIESYLVKVVPSEMPSRYGLEAAKIQAVCARSYAIKQIQQNACRAYHAHVDDSTTFQVYNNVAFQSISQQAVQETEGEVLTDAQGNLLSAYYFSTSCGYTTDISSWNEAAAVPTYLEKKAVMPQAEQEDIQEESVFRSMIMDWHHPGYELGMVWYRWKYECTMPALGAAIRDRLPAVIAQCGQMVWEVQNDGMALADVSVQLGELQEMEVTERGAGGIVQCVKITGSQTTLYVYGQTAIRTLLAAPDYMYENGSEEGRGRSESTLLPSGFFCLQPAAGRNELPDAVQTAERTSACLEETQTVSVCSEDAASGYVFWGGGNGHGIGMSQNGAYAMTQAGMNYREVLQFFYKGSEIRKITEDFAQS